MKTLIATLFALLLYLVLGPVNHDTSKFDNDIHF